ncbi:PREDICTED: uncharacterized protein LOC109585091 [Amphimedon queenslandica]|uniref:EF-hand domain-containing protein n=1 Tax=Amphimedon queenslandica TaxID=400682 RepID=A0AAN0JHZ5_AMPQE|nr:PREDICTED: uncharacterized protein LOC109585091 [Amphimedon queenslandica]|eukprot:XP_019856594.1 PREDICTED: uncharacterized protein LOC109585091 [Amphimedon queenslandica]
MEALGVKLLKGYLKVSLQDKLLPQFWSHFDANKSNYVILQEVLEAISDLTNSISFNNVIKEMKGLYSLQIISGINDKWAVMCKVLGLLIWAWLSKGGVAFKVVESLVKDSLIAYETTREGGGEREEEEMETETHMDQLWYRNEFQFLVHKLLFLGLRDQFLSPFYCSHH